MITPFPKATARLERRISAEDAEFWPHSRGAGVWATAWHFSIDILCEAELRVAGFSLMLRLGGWTRKIIKENKIST